MVLSRHGLAIGMERVEKNFFLSLEAVRKLTHKDYETIVPLIDSAPEGVKDPKVNVYFDGSELEGWEVRAAWDDFKLGLKHGNEFGKIAIVGNKKGQKNVSRITSWFVPVR